MAAYFIAIIAAIAGVIGAVFAGLQVRFALRRKKLKVLKGTWYEYHWTNAGGKKGAKFAWLESTLVASPKYLSSAYRLHYVNDSDHFDGTARYIDRKAELLNGDILFKVKHDRQYKETMYFRYNVPDNATDSIIAGIWTSYNFGKDITSGASILSRKPMRNRKLRKLFDELFEVNYASIIVKKKYDDDDIDNENVENEEFLDDEEGTKIEDAEEHKESEESEN